MAVAQDFDYIEGGPPERSRRRWPWITAAVVAGVAVLASLVLILDWGARSVEMNSLVKAIESSERVMGETQDAVTAALEEANEQGQLTPEQRQATLDELAVIAASGRDAVAAAGRRVANVRVLPWNRAIVSARTAYLAHSQAWIDYLAKASEDPLEFFAPQPAVNDTFYAARAPLEQAVPVPSVLDLKQRVQAIYADDPESSDGGTPTGETPALATGRAR